WYLHRWSWFGFELRATGENSRAARVLGRISTGRVFAKALLLSAAFAGLAGGIEITGVTFALFQNLSPGYGFSGIAVALLAGLAPLATVGSAVLFAALEAGASGMQRDAGVPAVAVYVVEATMLLVILLATAIQARRNPRPHD